MDNFMLQLQDFSREACSNTQEDNLKRISATVQKIEEIETKVNILKNLGNQNRSSLGAIAAAVSSFRDDSGQMQLEAQM